MLQFCLLSTLFTCCVVIQCVGNSKNDECRFASRICGVTVPLKKRLHICYFDLLSKEVGYYVLSGDVCGILSSGITVCSVALKHETQ